MQQPLSGGESMRIPVSRRTVLGATAALGVSSALMSARALAAVAMPLLHVYDCRFASGRWSAHIAAEQGIATWSIEGDVTTLWMEKLAAFVREGTGQVSGLTAAPALHCLAIMAQTEGWRVVRKQVVDEANALIAWSIARVTRGFAA